MSEIGDIDWDGAVRAIEDSPARYEQMRRAEMERRLTGDGTCASCKTEGVALFRTATSVEPDTCTACRGPVR